MAYNASLNAARSTKNDKFYTRYEDIEREMEAYLTYDRAYFVARQFYAVSFGLIICVCTSRLENSGICEALEKVTDARSREPKIDAVELFRAS